MPEFSNTTSTSQTYRAHDGAHLIEQVSKVIAILFPRGVMTAGFSAQGDLLMAKYTDYKDVLPVWIIDFFEHRFMEEKLFTNTAKVMAIFIACEKYLLVPDDLYDAEEANKWINKLYYVEPVESIDTYRLHDDRCRYLYTAPATIKNTITRYFPQAQLLPLASYQFFKPYKTDAILQCCISADYVYATAYKNKTLYWHQIFPYQNAEDIAYQINLMCKQYRIHNDNIEVQATVVHKGLNTITQDLTQYFPKLKYGNNAEGYETAKDWGKTVALLQQLFACAS